MKTPVRLLFLVLSSIVLFSQCSVDECYNKKVYLKNLDAFIDEVNEKYKDYDDDDWKKSNEKLKKYIEECYESLSDDEKKEIWAKTFKYYFRQYGLKLKNFLVEDDNEISAKFKEEMEKLRNYSVKDFEKIFREVFKDDLFNLIDSALEGLEEIGRQIKEELREE